MNRGLVIAGVVLLALSFLPFILLMTGPDSWESIVSLLVLTFFVAPFMFIGGLVLLIVGFVAGRGQQQQQQVVIVTEPHEAGVGGRACRRCRSRMRAGDRFCNSCGAPA